MGGSSLETRVKEEDAIGESFVILCAIENKTAVS